MNKSIKWLRVGTVMFMVSTFLFMMGCASVSPVASSYEPIVLQAADLTISLTFVDRETLIQRHGRNDARKYVNPYVDFPAKITPKRLIVFETDISTTESNVEFKLEDIDLRIGPKSGSAKSRNYLSSIWSHYNADLSEMESTMKRTILDRVFTVSPGQPTSGYLVFGENYPEEGGPGKLFFYLTTPDGDSGTLEMPITFGADGSFGDQNSGIFAE